MKKIKVSILALSVLVGGAVFASAADKLIVANTADPVITNVAPLVFYSVSDIPTSLFLSETNLNPASFGFVDTDGKGKIVGLFNAIKDWTEGTNQTIKAQSSWIGDVKGSIKASKMGQPSIQMTMKGNGYTSPTTNKLIINTQNSSSGNASINVNFKSSGAPVVVNTNTDSWKIIGTSKINFKPGITIIQSSKTVSETADLELGRAAIKTWAPRVVAYGTKFGVIFSDFFGTSSASKDGKFNLNLKNQSGENLSCKGQLSSAIIVSGGATNSVLTIGTVDIKGKLQGQAVEGKGIFSGFSD